MGRHEFVLDTGILSGLAVLLPMSSTYLRLLRLSSLLPSLDLVDTSSNAVACATTSLSGGFLIARIAEAEHKGWLGEVEGLRASLAGAEDKLDQIDRRIARTTELGMPSLPTKS